MSLATTFTDIANLALKSLGEEPVQSIDANDSRSKHLNQVLVQLPDNFADLDGLYRYQLPQDFLQVVEIIECNDWEVFGNALVTAAVTPRLIYKCYDSDVTKWSGELVELVYKKLAAELSMPVTQDPNILQMSTQRFELCRDRLLPQMKNRSRKRKQTLRRFSYLNVRDYTRNNYFGERPFNASTESE
jgi:hypothetical protein